ncbi:MAG: M48 family metallopeptidase [Lysobacterales bacterium]|jgi:Zn-dependent protease with chaperone function
MNFFEHQDRARKQSRWLILLFLLAVIAIVAAIDMVVLFALGESSREAGSPPLPLAEMLQLNAPLLLGGAVVSVAVITLASLFKVASLRGGGGQVARQLGATLVEADTQDPLRRRLLNVVEEIALASGVTVPEVYVLEHEAGINAFAAGYSAADAAVTVTEGALNKLSRAELQGVIAHEFSHILNGDMRINIRLMGALFGILLLALIGRRFLIQARFVRSSRDRNGAAIVLIAVGLTAIGYIGLFFGRWIKAALSRQREYLADASAVQFTREPDGIGGALKKIAVYSEGSYLDADAEEVSHMLFGDGRRMLLFSTHPPLNDRIARIDPQFRPEDLEQLAASIMREQQAAGEREERPSRGGAAGRNPLDPTNLVKEVGNPGWERMLMAAAVAASLPDAVARAARTRGWAPEVLFFTLLDADGDVRERQLLAIARRMGPDSESQTRALLQAAGPPAPEQRLPLLGLALPMLKRRPPEDLKQVLETAKELIDADQKVVPFEYLLARSIGQHIWESHNPSRVRISGDARLEGNRQEALEVMSILARHGNTEPEATGAAFGAGLKELGLDPATRMPEVADWVAALDRALPKLDRLAPSEKQSLVSALAAITLQDGRAEPVELELLRAICGLIHVPLPILSGQASG